MARIKKGREKERKGKDKKSALQCYISHPFSGCPNDVIFTKFGTSVDLTYVMTFANFDCNRLKGEHFVVVHNLPFSNDFNGWPYNRLALTCCRDVVSVNIADVHHPVYSAHKLLTKPIKPLTANASSSSLQKSSKVSYFFFFSLMSIPLL